jgi:hypothetical protein
MSFSELPEDVQDLIILRSLSSENILSIFSLEDVCRVIETHTIETAPHFCVWKSTLERHIGVFEKLTKTYSYDFLSFWKQLLPFVSDERQSKCFIECLEDWNYYAAMISHEDTDKMRIQEDFFEDCNKLLFMLMVQPISLFPLREKLMEIDPTGEFKQFFLKSLWNCPDWVSNTVASQCRTYDTVGEWERGQDNQVVGYFPENNFSQLFQTLYLFETYPTQASLECLCLINRNHRIVSDQTILAVFQVMEQHQFMEWELVEDNGYGRGSVIRDLYFQNNFQSMLFLSQKSKQNLKFAIETFCSEWSDEFTLTNLQEFEFLMEQDDFVQLLQIPERPEFLEWVLSKINLSHRNEVRDIFLDIDYHDHDHINVFFSSKFLFTQDEICQKFMQLWNYLLFAEYEREYMKKSLLDIFLKLMDTNVIVKHMTQPKPPVTLDPLRPVSCGKRPYWLERALEITKTDYRFELVFQFQSFFHDNVDYFQKILKKLDLEDNLLLLDLCLQTCEQDTDAFLFLCAQIVKILINVPKQLAINKK